VESNSEWLPLSPPERNLCNNLFFKVDKALIESCAKDGDYCKFNKRFLDLLKKLKCEKWFEEFSLINGEPD